MSHAPLDARLTVDDLDHDAALELRRRDHATARMLRQAMGEPGDLRERLALSGQKCLLVANSGGHVAQLDWLTRSTDLHEDSLWLTFRTPQTEALLAGRRVQWLPYVPPRGYRQLAPAAAAILGATAGERFDAAVSTGAGVAVPALLGQAAKGGRAVYVESISRVDGPSATGRLLARLPRIERYTQHQAWADERWTWAGSVLDGVELSEGAVRSSIGSVLVTLGTIRPYRFDRLVDRVVEALPSGVDVVWQTGCTTRRDLPGEVHAELPATRMQELFASSDLVVSHAGVATALQLAASGANCMLVPRRAAHGEHVDDHQTQIARLFAGAGLARVVEADRIVSTDFLPSIPAPRNVGHPDLVLS